MEEEKKQAEPEQWRGQVEAALPETAAGDAWPLVSSFCELQLYMPGIDVCERVAGADGQPGCVRYVASLLPDNGEVAYWAREELLAVEDTPPERSFSYSVVASNMGIGRYVATVRVAPAADGGGGCRLVWAFECDAMAGLTKEGFVAYLDAAATGIAKRVEEAVRARVR